MYSAFSAWVLVAGAIAGTPDPLRVCADPNNLPYSNQAGEGFENALATLVADDLHRPLEYAWFPQRRGFIRNTLKAKQCDVVMEVPAGYRLVASTTPYFTSSYVFVTRAADKLDIHSFDDPRLKRLRIGLLAIGDDYNNGPPAQALAARGIVDNIRGYSIYGDYSQPDPPRALIDAVARREVDVAIAWGPLAGYFAQREPVPLVVRAVDPDASSPWLRTRFAMAMGVRQGDDELKQILDGVIERRHGDIGRLLTRFGIPRVEGE